MTERTRAAPPWLADGARALWHEIHAYFATAWGFTSSPFEFADGWFAGRRTVMNPLAMMATGATIVAGTIQLAGAVFGFEHPDSLSATILSSLGPYVHYVLLGVICHAVLRPLSASRAHITDSIAAALFVGAGPAALAEALGWLVLCAVQPFHEVTPLMVGLMLGVAFSVFCFSLAAALSGIHRQAWWRLTFAFAIAFPVTGLIFGTLSPPGNYGLHWVMRIGGGFELGLGL